MENRALEAIIGLKVSSICCTAYQKQLRQELSKINGLYSIDIDPEKSLVTIRGRVDPDSLVDIVEGTGKKAEIVYYNKNPTNNKGHYAHAHAHDQGFTHHENMHDRYNNHSSAQRERNCSSCQDNRGHAYKEKEEEEHKCEDYVPPTIDERVCRDFYCKSHNMRPIISDRFPGAEGSGFFGHHNPWHGHGPGMFGEGYHMPPSAAYGFGSGRSMPGFEYGVYGNEHARGCVIM